MSKNKDRQRKRKVAQANRQLAMVKQVAGQVYADKATHDAALHEAWQQGYRQGLKHAASLASIAAVRKAAADHEEEAASVEA